MSLIEWKENFSVGFYTIDEQHKELFRLINNIMDIIKELIIQQINIWL